MTVMTVSTADVRRSYGMLVNLNVRIPTIVQNGDGTATLTWAPDLTAGEQTTMDRVLHIARSAVDSISIDEWIALEPDIQGLIQYQGIATPTLAQTVLAVKAQSRILRALLRD